MISNAYDSIEVFKLFFMKNWFNPKNILFYFCAAFALALIFNPKDLRIANAVIGF